MTDRINGPITYTAEPTNDGVRITVTRETITFVKEVIPDGQMAGMTGHREVRGEDTISFDLHTSEARALLDQLQQAIDSRPLSSEDHR